MEVLMHEASDLKMTSNVCKCQQPSRVKREEEKLPQNEFTLGHKAETMDLAFDNITFTVSLGFRKGSKEILHGVNGRFPAKKLIAIMGPSGAGKSTLLDILSGYRITSVGGTVYTNGRERDLNSFRRSSAYITQDDRLQSLLTVLENMRVSADLKLGTDTPHYEKETRIEEILTSLGLYEHSRTRASRLSGGQKKRLSIALELVNDPTVLFLDEPTTGLDSSSCMQVVKLLQILAQQGRTIVCTVHQPSASLLQLFDQVYVLARGQCLYQGATNQIVPYLDNMKLPCPMYHNPADYVIELSCGEYGEDKIDLLVSGNENGKSLKWFEEPNSLRDMQTLRAMNPLTQKIKDLETGLQATSGLHQLSVLLKRGFIKVERDSTLTHLRIVVNVCVGLMLGSLFINAGNEASRILGNYNLCFGILIHLMFTSMMLTILTFPTEMSILQKEHFNRWYSLKAFYISVNMIDIPVSVLSCFLFTTIVYLLSSQPPDMMRFSMFFVISLYVSFIAQSFGLIIGIVFDVVNGTFLGPVLSVPIMMYSGFGVRFRDLPNYMTWGTYVSYLRYALEGFVAAIYGLERPTLDCKEVYCHYKHPKEFLNDVDMRGDQFWNDIYALSAILVILRLGGYFCLRWKLMSSR